jgi:metallophosphoesterase superfamily enzyme
VYFDEIKLFTVSALLLQHEDIRALVVADLHIGWERILSQKGVHVPSQTTKIKNSLLKLLKTTKPTQLVVLGDIKDAITQVPREEWEDIPDFFESIRNRSQNTGRDRKP